MKLFILWCSFFCFHSIQAQFVVRNNTNATELAQKIVGQGVTILNPVFKGASVSAGFFVDKTGTVGIDSGIVLTTGRVETAGNGDHNTGVNGAASFTAGHQNGSASDADLNNLIGGIGNRQDACVLEFDFIPQGDSINVNFVFASDEYPQYNCTRFNDVFGFIVSGPGSIGKKNIALVPGTNIPVAINSINSGFISGAFGGNIAICSNMGFGSPFTDLYKSNLNNSFVTYNGLTKVLRAQLKVQPCQTYHIKLAIQDVIDGDYDSGVFLQASSFSSNIPSIKNIGGFNNIENNTIIVEGCNSSKVKVTLAQPASYNMQLPILVNGTAIAGVDYIALPNSLNFAIGEFEKEIDIVPLIDNLQEATETIILGIGSNACSSTSNTNVTIFLKDSIAFHTNIDTFICSKFSTVLSAKFIDTTSNLYKWNTGENTQQKIITTPGKYWVEHRVANNCYYLDTFTVINGDPIVSIGNDISLCETDSIQITAQVMPTGGNYLWNDGNTSSFIVVKKTSNVSLRYSISNGCFVDNTIQVKVKPLPKFNLGVDTSLCKNEKIILNAFYPSASYLWSTGATTASINVTSSANYYTTATLNGCTYSDTIFIGSKKQPLANAGNDVQIFSGVSTTLIAKEFEHNTTYLWSPNFQLSNVNNRVTIANPNTTTTYYLKVSSADNCIAYDTVIVTVKDGNIIIPNAFSPNGDGMNDVWEIKLPSSFQSAKVQVFNRQGQVVFSSVGYSTPWNGTHNGKYLPVGTYYFVIEPGNGLPPKSGWVTLLR